MRLGPLQKYILIISRTKQAPLSRNILLAYYKGRKDAPSPDDQINAVTKALEKMIVHNLIVAEGVKTAEKFFIKTIKITAEGRRAAKNIIGAQQSLPIKIKKK